MATLYLLVALLVLFVVITAPLAFFWKSKRRGILRASTLGFFMAAPIVLFVLTPYLLARFIVHAGSRPPDLRLKDTPADYGIGYETISFETPDGKVLSGWFVAPRGKNIVLICTHGLFRTRVEVLSRAMGAAKAGYGALLYDSRSHGSSDKGVVSFGYHEKNDVLGAIRCVRTKLAGVNPKPRIVLFGISMGAMTTLQAATVTRDYAGVILDSPFLSVKQTIADHARLFFALPKAPFVPLFLFWFARMAHVDVDVLDAEQALKGAQPVPLLLIASEGDRRMGIKPALRLYGLCGPQRAQLKVFGKDVSHGAAGRLHPEEYSCLLIKFLESLENGTGKVSDPCVPV
ncbi:MAG: alpha/beta fold hydrolase [Acidobacteriota bacterium]